MTIQPFKFSYTPQAGETCFSYLPKFVDEIDTAALEFLEQFPFVCNDEIANDIDTRAWQIFNDAGGDWEVVPEWVADVVDAGVPYCGHASHNGSLHHAIGKSVTGRDAYLRCFWENIKNGTNLKLPFPIVAPLIG